MESSLDVNYSVIAEFEATVKTDKKLVTYHFYGNQVIQIQITSTKLSSETQSI